MDTSGKILLFATGVGAVTVAAFYVWKNTGHANKYKIGNKTKVDKPSRQQSIEAPKNTGNCDNDLEQDGSAIKLERENGSRLDKAQGLSQIENSFFLELDQNITLTREQLDLLEQSAFQNDYTIDERTHIVKLSDLLVEMRDKKFFPDIKSYRNVITTVFLSSGIQFPVELEEHLSSFENSFPQRQMFDGIILHTDEDREMAIRLASILCNKFQVKIGLIEEITVAHSNLSSLDTIFEEAMHLLVLVTESYTLNAFTRYFAEGGLTKCLLDNQWRTVPLWAQDWPMNKRPAELRALKGIKCHKLCSDCKDEDAERCFNNLFSRCSMEI